ncbi:MAG: MarR family EPS-associated transcriptional regulator [Betaproteobacteria bacterium]
MLTEDLRYKLLKLLAEEPQISQRDLAGRLGISVGKTNYCLGALVDKGLVKINNFRRANNKLAYAYLLTPRGIEEKARVTVSFLQRKMREYAELQDEIEVLRRETLVSESALDNAPEAMALKRETVVGEAN